MYSTDNGPHMNTWPDGAMTPFRSEKNTNWEGAFRVPMLVRWPGKIAAGAVSNEIVQHHDWLPTFLAMAGEPDIVEKLKQGHTGGRQDVQGPHRRLQPAAVPDRAGEEEPAPGLHLLRRRRRPGGAALRQLEDRLHGAARVRARCASGRSRSCRCGCRSSSTCAPTRSSAPTSRRTPTTTGSSTTHYMILAAQAIVGAVPGDVQGVPAAPEGGELHHRPGDGEDERGGLRQTLSASGRPRRRDRAVGDLRRAMRARTALLRCAKRPPAAGKRSCRGPSIDHRKGAEHEYASERGVLQWRLRAAAGHEGVSLPLHAVVSTLARPSWALPRQRRNAVGGTTDILSGVVCPRQNPAPRPPTSGMEDHRAVRLGPQRR